MKIIGYMDTADFLHELGHVPGGISIYNSMDDILTHCPCAKNCGVTKVEVSYLEDALIGDNSENISNEDVEKRSIEHFRKKAEFYAERVQLLTNLANYREALLKRENV